jgi:hypothetical protein
VSDPDYEKVLDYEKFTFKSEKLFDRKIWSKFSF